MGSIIKTLFTPYNLNESLILIGGPRITSHHNSILKRNFSNVSENNEKSSEPDIDEGPSSEERELEIERIRSKSRLRPNHLNILYNKVPYPEPVADFQHTVKYNRRLYGIYGSESGVYPGIMWPTKSDIAERREYEKIAYPCTIQEMVLAAQKEIEIREEQIMKSQERIANNLAKLDLWKKELKDKIAKKEAEALAAKAKKEKLVEEVRRHFGFTIDPKDDRFKQMLELKEKEQKKREKQAKMEAREKKAIAKLMEKHASNIN